MAERRRAEAPQPRRAHHGRAAQEGPGAGGCDGVDEVHAWNLRAHGRAELLPNMKEKKLVYLREDGTDIRSTGRSSLKGDLPLWQGPNIPK
jgi:hypothetical protein